MTAFGTSFVVFREQWADTQTLQSFSDQVWDFRSGEKIVDTVLSLISVGEVFTESGHRVIRRVYETPRFTLDGDLLDSTVINVVVLTDEGGFELIGAAWTSRWEEDGPLLDAMVDSFR